MPSDRWNAMPGSALVTLDGSWTDADTDGHRERANHGLDGLDAETVVINVLCHC